METIVLDTDVASRIWRGNLTARHAHLLRDTEPTVTFVTVAEALFGARHADWGARRLDGLRAFYTDQLRLLRWEPATVEAYAHLRAGGARRGYLVPANDCWIAAVCVALDLPLLTDNRKHFEPLVALGLTLR